MSLDSLREFARRVQLEPELHERLVGAWASATVRVAADAGLVVTAEEVRPLIDAAAQELTDEQLEVVAGGLLGIPFPFFKEPPAD